MAQFENAIIYNFHQIKELLFNCVIFKFYNFEINVVGREGFEPPYS